MADHAQITAQHLIKLIQDKKVKEFSAYLQYLQDQTLYQSVEKSIVKALINNLVDKKTTPNGVLYALYFYKIILVRAKLDFLQYEEAFPNKIHEAVFQICKYNYDQPINNRGSNYFIQKMKASRTQEVQSIGNALVCLALEIVMNMAHWYPLGFIDQKKSRFAFAYQKLKKSGVQFPQYGTFIHMKKKDKELFQTSYQKLIEKFDLSSQENHQTPQGKYQTPDGNHQNIQAGHEQSNVPSKKNSSFKKQQNVQNCTIATNIYSQIKYQQEINSKIKEQQQQHNINIATKGIALDLLGKPQMPNHKNSKSSNSKPINQNVKLNQFDLQSQNNKMRQIKLNQKNEQPCFILQDTQGLNKIQKSSRQTTGTKKLKQQDIMAHKQQILERNDKKLQISWINNPCESASDYELKIQFGLEKQNPQVKEQKHIPNHLIEQLNKRVAQLQEENKFLRVKSYKVTHNTLNRTEYKQYFNPKVSYSIKSSQSCKRISKGLPKVEKIHKRASVNALKNSSITYQSIKQFKEHNLQF